MKKNSIVFLFGYLLLFSIPDIFAQNTEEPACICEIDFNYELDAFETAFRFLKGLDYPDLLIPYEKTFILENIYVALLDALDECDVRKVTNKLRALSAVANAFSKTALEDPSLFYDHKQLLEDLVTISGFMQDKIDAQCN